MKAGTIFSTTKNKRFFAKIRKNCTDSLAVCESAAVACLLCDVVAGLFNK
jgi:hypothetical protein